MATKVLTQVPGQVLAQEPGRDLEPDQDQTRELVPATTLAQRPEVHQVEPDSLQATRHNQNPPRPVGHLGSTAFSE